VRRAALLALLVAFAPPAEAADGRLEINQACALAGCFSNDTPGFPVSVLAGSYVLTSNLTVPDAQTTAISGNADVSIDLNGFAITGVTNCTGAPAVCTGTGAGYGISLGARASIRNGTIRRMGNVGVGTGLGSIIENMTIAENGGNGISASDKAQQIVRCRVLQNGSNGAALYYGNSQGSLIQGNTFYGNGDYGVQMIGGSMIDNVATYNGDEGFYMASYTNFHGNKAAENNGGNANDQAHGGVDGGGNVCATGLCP
jgi:hypothetical protein